MVEVKRKKGTVSGENWSFTVRSVDNTGAQRWRVANAPSLYKKTYLEIEDESRCFWRLKVDVTSMNNASEFLTDYQRG